MAGQSDAHGFVQAGADLYARVQDLVASAPPPPDPNAGPGQGSRVDLQQMIHNKTDHLRSVVGHVLVIGLCGLVDTTS